MGHLLWVNGKKKKKASAIVYFINPFVGLRLASPTENLDSRISVTWSLLSGLWVQVLAKVHCMAFFICLHYLSRLNIVVFVYVCICGLCGGKPCKSLWKSSTFIATLSHSDEKALIVTNWKNILFNCIV